MARKKLFRKRRVQPDPKYNDIIVSRFISTIMRRGKKAKAEGILYGALDIGAEKSGERGLDLFKKALEKVKPDLEVKSRRVGGATYQVPVEVGYERGISLASRWIVESSKERSEHSMRERLAGEFLDAIAGRGGAAKKREDTHRMAEANRAFSHFRW